MKKMLNVIFILALIIGSVSASNAVMLVWDNGDASPVGGYVVGWGPTQASPSSGGTATLDSKDCTPGTDPTNDPYACSYTIPAGLVTEGQTLWLTVKAFNYNADGTPCPTCESAWATPISYTNQGTGNTGTKPGVPTGIKIVK